MRLCKVERNHFGSLWYRDNYAASDLPGGITGTFKLKGKEYLRRDIQLVRPVTVGVMHETIIATCKQGLWDLACRKILTKRRSKLVILSQSILLKARTASCLVLYTAIATAAAEETQRRRCICSCHRTSPSFHWTLW